MNVRLHRLRPIDERIPKKDTHPRRLYKVHRGMPTEDLLEVCTPFLDPFLDLILAERAPTVRSAVLAIAQALLKVYVTATTRNLQDTVSWISSGAHDTYIGIWKASSAA